MKSSLSILFLSAFLLLPVQAPGFSESFNGTVIGVLEGDLVRVLHRGKVFEVRLSDVDCPGEGQAYGLEAKQFTAMLVQSGPVMVYVKKRDHLGIPIAEVVLKDSGQNLNHELIKAGLAWWQRDFSDDTRYQEMEAAARKMKLGLWKQNNPIPPWEFRKKGEAS